MTIAQKVESEPLPFVFCLAAAALVAEIEAGMALAEPADYATASLIHLTTIAFLGLAVVFLASGKRDYRFSLLLLLGGAALGPFGALLALMSMAVYAASGRTRDPLIWMNAFFLPSEDDERKRLRVRLALGLEKPFPQRDVEPFQDILAQGTLSQKRSAIAKMTRYFNPAFTPLLLQAARSDKAAVRVQAATALAHIERDFMVKRMRLEKEIRRLPTLSVRLELAGLYDAYAFSGLADENSRDLLRDKAIEIYARALERAKDPRLLARLARLYVRRGRDEQAIALLTAPALSGTLPPETAPWYMECLFRQRRFDDLRRFVALSGRRPQLDSACPKLGDVLSVWREKDAA